MHLVKNDEGYRMNNLTGYVMVHSDDELKIYKIQIPHIVRIGKIALFAQLRKY